MDTDAGAGGAGGAVDPGGVIELMCHWGLEMLDDNRLSSLLPGPDDGMGEEGGE